MTSCLKWLSRSSHRAHSSRSQTMETCHSLTWIFKRSRPSKETKLPRTWVTWCQAKPQATIWSNQATKTSKTPFRDYQFIWICARLRKTSQPLLWITSPRSTRTAQCVFIESTPLKRLPCRSRSVSKDFPKVKSGDKVHANLQEQLVNIYPMVIKSRIRPTIE